MASRFFRASRRLLDLHQAAGLDLLDRNLMPDKVLNVGERDRRVLAAETDRVAGCTGARRAADSVDVVLSVLRKIIIKHVSDIRNVQSSRRDVGADQDGQITGVELFQHSRTFALGHITRYRSAMDAVVLQVVL